MTAKIIDEQTIHVFDKSQFDWYAIRNCGQIFLDPPCDVIADGEKIIIRVSGDKDAKWLWNYFDLDTDYNEIKKELSSHKALCEALAVGGGIRILRQPFVQNVISFIISANNNIKRFSKTLKQIDFENMEKYSKEDFIRMGCGYRAPYLVEAVRQLSDMEFSVLDELPNNFLYKELVKIKGVGDKVARCIMLFCFHRLDVAPVDTWMEKAYDMLFGLTDDKMTPKIKAERFRQKFGRYAGVAQQYIFYYLQHLKKEM